MAVMGTACLAVRNMKIGEILPAIKRDDDNRWSKVFWAKMYGGV